MSKLAMVESAVLIPTWAAVYLVTGEWDDLTESDKTDVDNWIQSVYDRGFNCLTYQFGETSDFEVKPAFGLPAECIEVEVWGHSIH